MARYSFTGRFGALCQTTNIIERRRANPLNLNFYLGASNETDLVLGSISDGIWSASLYGERIGLFSRTNPAPYAGSYTLAIPGYTTSSNSLGNGFSAVHVSTNGIVRFTGDLADGTKITHSSAVSSSGMWPFYVPLYSGNGLIIGWLTFTNDINSVIEGPLNWLKLPGPKAPFYSNGLALVCEPVASPYQARGGQLFTPTNVIMQADAGGTPSTSTNQIMNFHFASSSGLFKGSVLDPLTGKPLTFKGTVLQNLDKGYGFIWSTNQSFPVLVIP